MLQNNQQSTWKRTIAKGALALSAALLIVTAATGCGKSPVVATYKDGEITEKQLNTYMNTLKFVQPSYAQILDIPEFKEQILKQYIGTKILYARADDKAKKDAAPQVDEQMKGLETALKQPEVKNNMKDLGISEDDVKQYFDETFTIVKDAQNKVTDEQMKAFYDKSPADFSTITLRHILIGTTDPNTGAETRKKEDALKRAKEVQDKLKTGDFAALAKEYSDDTGSKENGGQYKDQKAYKWVDEFKKAATTLALNTISDPIETQFGYHVMKVESRTETPFDKLTQEDKDFIRGNVAQQTMGDFMAKDLPNLITNINLPKTETETDKEGEKKDEGTKTDDTKKEETAK